MSARGVAKLWITFVTFCAQLLIGGIAAAQDIGTQGVIVHRNPVPVGQSVIFSAEILAGDNCHDIQQTDSISISGHDVTVRFTIDAKVPPPGVCPGLSPPFVFSANIGPFAEARAYTVSGIGTYKGRPIEPFTVPFIVLDTATVSSLEPGPLVLLVLTLAVIACLMLRQRRASH